MLRISVFDSKELQATILGIRAANKTVRAEIRRFTQAEVSPDWKTALAEHAETTLEHRVLADTSRVKVSDQNVTLSAATVGRPLSGKGSAKPADIARAVEFGANRNGTTTYSRRTRKGKTATVHNRHTRHQFRAQNRQGYVVYPSAAQMIPRYASLWVQTCIRTIMDAVDGGK